MPLRKVAVLGAGSWGTALAITLAGKGFKVMLWARKSEDAEMLNQKRENLKYLKGCLIPDNVEATSNLEKALEGAEAVVLSVPSHAVREVVRKCRKKIEREAVLINTAKGLELETLKRLTEVMKEELPDYLGERIAVLSGPSHAEEVGVGMPTTVVASAYNNQVAEYVQDLFITSRFRVYTNPDVIGVELGGALKNVIALATGISDGLGFGDNTRAALMTRGIAEISRLGIRMGASPLTFAGLAGIGDLIVTCTSRHSRNRRAGIQLGQGKKLDEVLEDMGMVVEGVKTTKAAYELSRRYGVEMPITEQVYGVLFEGRDPKKGVNKLMGRVKTKEVEEVVLYRQKWQ
ncbi:MAG: Glycerol-3-phosphate dehydrogenase (NAD(P)+) [Clostridia bacterium 41_269]|nr:MAG: Glycerol-3-phosphate dehydrogenase (NAD(P)+) [Clostridia bacterium 41_269]